MSAAFALGVILPGLAHAQTTVLFLDSQPGDYIGGGVQHTVTPATGSFIASRNFDNGVTIQVNTGGGGWSLAFAAPGDATLVEGTYDNATRWPFQSPTNPGLSVNGMGRGCNTLTGNFVVREALYDASGQVQAFAADFEQHCEGMEPALFGGVRYHSTIGAPPVQLPPAKCGSRVTSVADLQAEVDGLAAATQTKNELSNTLQQAQAALDGGSSDMARRWIGTFIQQAVNRSNLPATNQNRLEFSQANMLACGAANVLLNVAAPQ